MKHSNLPHEKWTNCRSHVDIIGQGGGGSKKKKKNQKILDKLKTSFFHSFLTLNSPLSHKMGQTLTHLFELLQLVFRDQHIKSKTWSKWWTCGEVRVKSLMSLLNSSWARESQKRVECYVLDIFNFQKWNNFYKDVFFSHTSWQVRT